MEKSTLEKILKLLVIIFILSFAIKAIGVLLSVVFGITTLLLIPILVLAFYVGIPVLIVFGIYKLFFDKNNVW